MITFDWLTIIIGLYDNLFKKSFYIVQFIMFMDEDEQKNKHNMLDVININKGSNG
jgi:hypothetical protein